MTHSDIAKKAAELILSRDLAGQAKYGKTMDRTDLTPQQWLRHAIEEHADALQYMLALERDIDARAGPNWIPYIRMLNAVEDFSEQEMVDAFFTPAETDRYIAYGTAKFISEYAAMHLQDGSTDGADLKAQQAMRDLLPKGGENEIR